MGRRKVRHYNGRDFYRNLFDEYFRSHSDEVLEYTVKVMGFESLRAMRDEEMTGVWFDCGWILLRPKNAEWAHEWFLDDDRISSYLYVSNPCYNTQSTTIKEIMVKKALKDLGLENDFSVTVRLD